MSCGVGVDLTCCNRLLLAAYQIIYNVNIDVIYSHRCELWGRYRKTAYNLILSCSTETGNWFNFFVYICKKKDVVKFPMIMMTSFITLSFPFFFASLEAWLSFKNYFRSYIWHINIKHLNGNVNGQIITYLNLVQMMEIVLLGESELFTLVI